MTSRISYNDPDSNGYFGLPYHYELLSDRRRLGPLRRAIASAAPGRRVLESGTGSGILSILAARAGARMVYATEPDPKVAAFARHNVERSGYSDVIRIIEKDTRCLCLHDIGNSPVDMVIAEHLSTWQVTEAQIPVMNHVNAKLATERAIRIPDSLTNYVELVYSNFTFERVVELRTLYLGFSGVAKPVVLSETAEVQRVRFDVPNPMSVNRCVKVRATRAGVVNSLRLTSPLVLGRNIRFRSSDSLVPPVIVPLPEDVEVSEGDFVWTQIEYDCATNWDRMRCRAQVVGSEGQDLPIEFPVFRAAAL